MVNGNCAFWWRKSKQAQKTIEKEHFTPQNMTQSPDWANRRIAVVKVMNNFDLTDMTRRYSFTCVVCKYWHTMRLDKLES